VIVDTSALIAILNGELEADAFARRVAKAGKSFIASATYLETCMVWSSRKEPTAIADVDEMLLKGNIEILPFSPDASRIAATAFLTYGKGRGHPARLNFGDCISYAMSKTELMPLLFKGNDFRLTDVDCAL
jgi:ribonuclease VapC